MNTSTTTFWKLLSDVGIEIPIIQRDYAQGRSGKEELRKSFLRYLKDALNRNEPMRLDFVYGTMESGKLIPLDGQQRLTTLWLLHWYLAYRAGKLSCPCTAACLKKFTYETRISSRLFCENLAGFSVLPPADTDIADHIRDQRWFRRVWRSDPTIQAMLRMLSGTLADKSDGIEGVFNCSSEACKGYWEKLTSPDCPIVFYNLPLPSIAHSDDLYIKMNARGKPLTSFENFKADLAGYIENEKHKNRSLEWGKLYDPSEGLPIRMDTKWMRLFWASKSTVNTVDEAYFTFVNRIFFSEVCLAKTDGNKWLVPSDKENANDSYRYLNDSQNGSYYDCKIAYTSLAPYKFHNGEIPMGVLQNLKKTMDAFCDFMSSCKGEIKNLNELIPKCEWDKEFKFIPEYTADKLKDNAGNEIRKVTILTQPQRVVFFAVCKFFYELERIDENNFEDTKRKLEKWLRVVWNLVSIQDEKGDYVIRTFSAMRTAMEFIKDLDSQNVYGCLANKKSNGDSAFELQCKEEIEKAKKILCDATGSSDWENKIIEAEKYAFFHGAIRFLFHNETGNVNWDDFDTKYLNAKKYFDKDGIKEGFKVSLTKNLVLQCSSWDKQLYDQQIFNPDKSTWRWILCTRIWEVPIHNLLVCDNLDNLVASETLGDENANKYIKPILESLPYSTIIASEPSGRFRRYGPLAFYRPKAHYAMFTLDWEDFKRNSLLQYLIKNKDFELQKQHIIEESGQFYKGWDIRFKYNNNHCFLWGADNKIYLLDEKNQYVKGKEDKYLCFDTKGIDKVEKLKDKLDELLH